MTGVKWDRAHEEISRLERFLKALTELSREHRIAVKGCSIHIYPAVAELEDSHYVLHPTLQAPDPDVGLQIAGGLSVIEWVEDE